MENPQDSDPTKWYYALNGQSEGPFSVLEIKQLLQVGHVTEATLLAEAGGTEWLPLSTAFQLKEPNGINVPLCTPERNTVASVGSKPLSSHMNDDELDASPVLRGFLLIGAASLTFMILMIPVVFISFLFLPFGICGFIGVVVGLVWGVKRMW